MIEKNEIGQPLVSIITPAYNCEKYISETIESVIAQTYQNWEMIIVDDCSKDNTLEVIKTYAEKDDRIKWHRLEVNSGAAIARNTAVSKAKGKYVAFIDSDDMWLEMKLEKQVFFMEENNYNFTCTSYSKINELGNPIKKAVKAKPKSHYKKILANNTIGNSTAMYNAKELGYVTIPNIKKRNDFVMWLKILKKEKYVYGISEPLAQYRIRNGSLSNGKKGLIKYQWYVYREIEKISFIKSSYYLLYNIIIKVLRIK